MADPFYITTAIAYPNGKPHIGHAYEAIAADVIARFQRAEGRDVRFQTGTDEHGLKMAQKAREMGITPRELCDEMSSHFRAMCDALNISYDVFQRTTDPKHYAASQELWRRMAAKDDLYLDRYEGWYSVRDEAFYDESELITGEGAEKLSPQGTPVEWTVEESWFFRLSKYQAPLLAYFAANPDFIQPESRRNEVIRFVEGGLRDLSVSRTSFDWGVPVPDAPGHVMYVWVDALTNYLTGLGFPEQTPEMDKWWPANIHLIGKDIVRFHTVYWPAFLMSADLALPNQVFGHGFLLHRGEKMSKSLGNVVDPLELAERFGVDSLRYFLMREVSFGNDGSYSAEAIVTRCNAELANSFGNLAQRVLSFIAKNLDGELPGMDRRSLSPEDESFLVEIEGALGDFAIEMRLLNIDRAIQKWMAGVFAANAYVDTQAPWALRKTDPERMSVVLGVLVTAIRDLALAISPVVINGATKVLDLLGDVSDRRYAINPDGGWNLGAANWRSPGHRVIAPTASFPRLDLPTDEAGA
jgi:methionyl-tRNA synthetase